MCRPTPHWPQTETERAGAALASATVSESSFMTVTDTRGSCGSCWLSWFPLRGYIHRTDASYRDTIENSWRKSAAWRSGYSAESPKINQTKDRREGSRFDTAARTRVTCTSGRGCHVVMIFRAAAGF